MQKQALAIHDISCVGRCSLTVALPILSCAGICASAVPTALLSTHTGEFEGYTHLDLTDELAPIANHLSTLDIRFDAIYTGYLASGEQAEIVGGMIDTLRGESTQIFVDPAFADHGRLYSLIGGDMPRHMRALVSRADTIVPNLTEACFLLERDYAGDRYDREYIRAVAADLACLGPDNVVITDIAFSPDKSGVAVYQNSSGIISFMDTPRYDGVFHGTGDVLASFLLGALMNGMPLVCAAELALDCTRRAIEYTLADGQRLRYGVQFERALCRYMEAIREYR